MKTNTKEGMEEYQTQNTAESLGIFPLAVQVFGRTKEVVFEGWHNKEYLRVCMANLYEKHRFGIGKSRITDEEWKRLCDGYRDITGEEYKI